MSTNMHLDDAAEEAHVEQSLPSSPILETPPHSRAYSPDSPAEKVRSHNDADDDQQAQSDEAEPSPADGDGDGEQDDRQCRICFAGTEEEEALGRLISPCLCTGSMRYVHVQCINAWRGTGTNAKAFMECPQCHHQYRLRRTLASGLATSRPILILSTALLFFFITLTLGQILHLFLRFSPSALRQIRSRRSSITTMYDLFDNDFAYDDGPVIIVGGGAAPMYDLVTAAISTVFDMIERYSSSREKLAQRLPSPIAVALFGLVVRFFLGLALLGSMSFMSLLISLSLFGPLQLVNGLRGMGFLGNWGRRRGRDEGGTAIGTIMIIVFVLIGAVNTLIQVYGGVQKLTQRLLKYVETQILEVNPDDRKRAEERHRARNTWFRRWMRDRRWKSLQGWREVNVRLRLRFEAWKDSMRHGDGEAGRD